MKRSIKILSLSVIGVIISAGTIGTLFFLTVIQTASPSGRYGSAMVYDPILQKMIFYGGAYQDATGSDVFDDMWFFDPTFNIWTEINPTVKPAPRSGHSMVYDSINHKTILFGGWVENVGMTSDTWIYDSQTNQWTEVFPLNHPSNRQDQSMYYDSKAQKVILYGGFRGFGGYYGDTWEYVYSNNSWINLNPSNGPPSRYGSKIVYDNNNNRGFLFGGRSTTIKDDKWVYFYGNNTWKELNITNKPDTRYWHGMVYDPNSNKIVVFGGYHVGAPEASLEDMWIFDPTNNQWTEVLPETHPSNRLCFTMIYDSRIQITILFGGIRGTDNNLGDTWALNHGSNSWYIVKGSDP